MTYMPFVLNRQVVAGFAVAALMAGTVLPAPADDAGYYNDPYAPERQTSWTVRHPVVEKSAIGAGAGALLGGVLDSHSRTQGALGGALLGGGAGAAFGALQQRGRENRDGYAGSRPNYTQYGTSGGVPNSGFYAPSYGSTGAYQPYNYNGTGR